MRAFRVLAHDLRHTAASLAIDAGEPLHCLRDRLGPFDRTSAFAILARSHGNTQHNRPGDQEPGRDGKDGGEIVSNRSTWCGFVTLHASGRNVSSRSVRRNGSVPELCTACGAFAARGGMGDGSRRDDDESLA